MCKRGRSTTLSFLGLFLSLTALGATDDLSAPPLAPLGVTDDLSVQSVATSGATDDLSIPTVAGPTDTSAAPSDPPETVSEGLSPHPDLSGDGASPVSNPSPVTEAPSETAPQRSSPPASFFSSPYALLVANSVLLASTMGLTASILPDGNVFIAPLTGAAVGGLFTYGFLWDQPHAPGFPLFLGSAYGYGALFGYSAYTLSPLRFHGGRRVSILSGELLGSTLAYLRRDLLTAGPEELLTIDLASAAALGLATGVLLQFDTPSERVVAGTLGLVGATSLVGATLLCDKVHPTATDLHNTFAWALFGGLGGLVAPGTRRLEGGFLLGLSAGLEFSLLENRYFDQAQTQRAWREVATYDAALFGLSLGLLLDRAVGPLDKDETTQALVLGSAMLGRAAAYVLPSPSVDLASPSTSPALIYGLFGAWEGFLLSWSVSGEEQVERRNGGMLLGGLLGFNGYLLAHERLTELQLGSPGAVLLAPVGSMLGFGLGSFMTPSKYVKFPLAAAGGALGVAGASRYLGGKDLPLDYLLGFVPGVTSSILALNALEELDTNTPQHRSDGIATLTAATYPLLFFFQGHRRDDPFLDTVTPTLFSLTGFSLGYFVGNGWFGARRNTPPTFGLLGLNLGVATALLQLHDLPRFEPYAPLAVMGVGYTALGLGAIVSGSTRVHAITLTSGLLLGGFLESRFGLGARLSGLLGTGGSRGGPAATLPLPQPFVSRDEEGLTLVGLQGIFP